MIWRLQWKSDGFKRILISSRVLLFIFLSVPACGKSNLPKLFLFVGGDTDLKTYQKTLSNPCITGVQVIYSWKKLEPKKGVYDFSEIDNNLAFLNGMHKKLFIQLQDRSFDPNNIPVPDYLREDKIYKGGVAMQFDFAGKSKPITEGWVAKVWAPPVRERFQQLMTELAIHFDGKIDGINLPETAVDFNPKKLPEEFSPDKYFYGELENLDKARKTFHHTIVMQYVNFFPGEWNNNHQYMSRLFSYAEKHHISLGGPDVVPYRKGQMENSYPFFHQYGRNLPEVGMAIQSPDYKYENPMTRRYYHFFDLYSFAKNYLGATIIFVDVEASFFSKEVEPKLTQQYFSCTSQA
jgi:hypothetical protein